MTYNVLGGTLNLTQPINPDPNVLRPSNQHSELVWLSLWRQQYDISAFCKASVKCSF